MVLGFRNIITYTKMAFGQHFTTVGDILPNIACKKIISNLRKVIVIDDYMF